MTCIFCKIVQKEIPARIIAEDDDFIAFLDIAPATMGHTLIIPKKHSENILGVPAEEGSELLAFTQRIAVAVDKATHNEGFNLVVNTGKSAGQAVFHTHVHIVPRRTGDGLMLWAERAPVHDAELASVAERIKQFL
jgi:histidine triad (HIT) family protein